MSVLTPPWSVELYSHNPMRPIFLPKIYCCAAPHQCIKVLCAYMLTLSSRTVSAPQSGGCAVLGAAMELSEGDYYEVSVLLQPGRY